MSPAITGIGDDPRVFQLSVPVQAENDEGPLIDATGEVVGIVTGKLSADRILKATGELSQNVNYAIKARYLQGLLDDLGNRSKIVKPRAGSVAEIVEQIKGAVFLVVVE
jgi:S1-C subfamily serine protease